MKLDRKQQVQQIELAELKSQVDNQKNSIKMLEKK